MDKYKIRTLYENNLLQDIDIQFSNLLADLSENTASDELCLASVLVSSTTTGEKHICFDLEAGAGKSLADLFPEAFWAADLAVGKNRQIEEERPSGGEEAE